MITFKDYLEESKYPDHSPMTQKSEADVKKVLGTGKFNAMIKHAWFNEYGSYQKAYKHGVTRAGFHQVEVYPYMKEVHATPEGAVRPTTMLTFDFSPSKITQVHKFTRSKEKDAAWKHVKSWKKDYISESVSIESVTSDFIKHYKDDPAGAFMHAKSSYLDAVSTAKNFSMKAAELHRSHASMSKQEFQDTVMKHFGKHLQKHSFPKHASDGWGKAEQALVGELSK